MYRRYMVVCRSNMIVYRRCMAVYRRYIVVYRRYIIVYRRNGDKNSVNTTVFLSSVCHYKIIQYARITFRFIRQCFTREVFKVLQTRHCTNYSRLLEKLHCHI